MLPFVSFPGRVLLVSIPASVAIPRQAAGYLTLNVRLIEQMAIPLPGVGEQHRIVAKGNELLAACDRLEAQLTVTRCESRRLLEAVLQEALAPTA
jgi:type I restriction enzyme S subunit